MDTIVSTAKELFESGSQPSIGAAIQYVLNEGIFNIPVSSTTSLNITSLVTSLPFLSSITQFEQGTCCPDCNIYYLGSLGHFQQYYDSLIPSLSSCCLNIFSDVETKILLQEVYTNNEFDFPELCCNNFNSCINDILASYKVDCYSCNNDGFLKQLEYLLESPIIEYGTIGGKSIVCDFLTALINNNIDIDNDDCLFLSLLVELLQWGVVVWCKEFCDTVLAAEDNDEILTENNKNIQIEDCPQNCNIVWQTVGSSYDNDGFISTIEEGTIMVTMSTNGPSGAGTGFDPINLDGVEYAQCSNGLICSNYSNVSPTNQVYYIKGDAAGVVTMTFDFSPAITDPILGIWSLGSPSEQQIFKPNIPFIELSGCGEDPSVVCGVGNATGLAISDTGITFGTNTYQISGNESFGIVKFPGTHSQIQIQVPFLSEYRTNLAWGLSCVTLNTN
jgi:hypothetical protein